MRWATFLTFATAATTVWSNCTTSSKRPSSLLPGSADSSICSEQASSSGKNKGLGIREVFSEMLEKICNSFEINFTYGAHGIFIISSFVVCAYTNMLIYVHEGEFSLLSEFSLNEDFELGKEVEINGTLSTLVCNEENCLPFAVELSLKLTAAEQTKNIPEVMNGLDILVNNAGIKKDNLLMRMDKEDFDTVINTNLSSVFNLTKSSIRTFLKQRSGSIINISSVVGVKGNAGQSNYSASKAGIIGFSKSIALELGSRNIRSNVIAPGFIETEMTARLSEEVVQGWRSGIPLKRGGTPKDVAEACVFLASDLSSYITGQVLHVDGGMLT